MTEKELAERLRAWRDKKYAEKNFNAAGALDEAADEIDPPKLRTVSGPKLNMDKIAEGLGGERKPMPSHVQEAIQQAIPAPETATGAEIADGLRKIIESRSDEEIIEMKMKLRPTPWSILHDGYELKVKDAERATIAVLDDHNLHEAKLMRDSAALLDLVKVLVALGSTPKEYRLIGQLLIAQIDSVEEIPYGPVYMLEPVSKETVPKAPWIGEAKAQGKARDRVKPKARGRK